MLIAGDGQVRARFTLEQLLPHSFGPEHLGQPLMEART